MATDSDFGLGCSGGRGGGWCDAHATAATGKSRQNHLDMIHSTPMRRIALGCMRLSTEADRDEARAVATIHAALDAGIRLFDTARAYALDDGELGHNERLLARALAGHPV